MILETANPEFDTIIETLVPKYGKTKVTMVYADGIKTTRRIGRAFDEAIMVYRVGSKRYGYYLEKRHYISIIFPEKKATENDKWIRSWTNVLKRLQKSGLWEELADEIKTGLDIGLEKIKQAYDIENEFNNELDYYENNKQQAIRIQGVDSRLVKTREDGSVYPRTDILWHMRFPARVKKMYFGKYDNDAKLNAIKISLDGKIKYSDFGRANYDIHYEYHPDTKRAFYNEEYKNCGNGHYYLALDATHALFYEDD